MNTLTAEALNEFTEWLAREMPGGTVISDPRWWAPRIAARLAAGQQGAGDDVELDLSTHGVNRRWGIAYYEVDFGDEGKGVYVRREDFERIVRELATPQPPQPAGAVPLPEVLYAPNDYGAEDKLCWHADAIRYGDAREAAGRADAVPGSADEAAVERALVEWFSDESGRDDGPETGWAAVQKEFEDGGEHFRADMRAALVAAGKISPAPAPQQMTTQGEALKVGDRVEWTNIYGTEFAGQVKEINIGYKTALDDGTEIVANPKNLRRLTGSQP